VSSEHRSGYVAVAGRPNVGKSTLVNRYLGESILPVSPRPQTTHRRQLGILTLPTAQVVFVDAPGMHSPRHRLGVVLDELAHDALRDADLVLCLFDLSRGPNPDDRRVAGAVTSSQKPHLAAFNKIDLTPPAALQANWEAYEQLLPAAPVYGVSATRGDNLDQLLEGIVERLPAGPAYFPDAELTDSHERELAADLIRAAALQALRQEVPHSIAVLIDEFRERDGRGAWIAATLFVERESQKGIVIGKGGHMLREIGTLARKDIERMSGRTIYLQLRVKVLPKWRNDEQALRRLGYRSRTPSRRP
jgi:GTP-binding protein Era